MDDSSSNLSNTNTKPSSPNLIQSNNNNSLSPNPTKKNNKQLPIIIAICAVLIIGLGIGIYFLFFNNHSSNTNGSDDDLLGPVIVKDIDDDFDGTETVDDYLEKLSDKVESSTNDTERLDNIFDQVTFLIISERPDEAINLLNTIDHSSFKPYDEYRLYNYYVSAYKLKDDTESINHYQALSDDALERDLAQE